MVGAIRLLFYAPDGVGRIIMIHYKKLFLPIHLSSFSDIAVHCLWIVTLLSRKFRVFICTQLVFVMKGKTKYAS